MAKHKIDFEREFAKLCERLKKNPKLSKADLVREALLLRYDREMRRDAQ